MTADELNARLADMRGPVSDAVIDATRRRWAAADAERKAIDDHAAHGKVVAGEFRRIFRRAFRGLIASTAWKNHGIRLSRGVEIEEPVFLVSWDGKGGGTMQPWCRARALVFLRGDREPKLSLAVEFFPRATADVEAAATRMRAAVDAWASALPRRVK